MMTFHTQSLHQQFHNLIFPRLHFLHGDSPYGILPHEIVRFPMQYHAKNSWCSVHFWKSFNYFLQALFVMALAKQTRRGRRFRRRAAFGGHV
jgi:hypothetical protein